VNATAPLPQSFEVGIRSRVPGDEYRSLAGTSITRLKELRRSAQHYAYLLTHPKESQPITLGVAAHTAVLEPERFAQQFAVWGERTGGGALRPRRGKDWEAFENSHVGTTIITADEEETVRAIQAAVRTNPIAARYLEAGDPEVTLQWLLNGRQCRGRVDWLTAVDDKPVLVGLKTARDCRHFIFGSAAAKLAYHWQWAFYYDGYKEITGREPKMVELVVESAPPHAVAVYTIPDDVLDQGRDEYDRALVQLDECERTGYFPGPQETEEPLSLPSWAFESQDDISALGLEL